MSALLVLCTCPDSDSAQRVATALVNEHLAACVNLLPGMTSVYRWEGSLQNTREVQLIIKTCAARQAALMARVSELHPYQVPELLVIPVSAGLPAYLAWVAAQTCPPLEES